jgi:hypothetical protein
VAKTGFISGLKKTRAKFTMNLKSTVNDYLTDLIFRERHFSRTLRLLCALGALCRFPSKYNGKDRKVTQRKIWQIIPLNSFALLALLAPFAVRLYPGQRDFARDHLCSKKLFNFSLHTIHTASYTMCLDILETPMRRSTNTMGISWIRYPFRHVLKFISI